MHPADINAALQKAGSSQSAVARSLRNRKGGPLTPGAVHNVIKGRSHSAQVAIRIAQVTGLTVAELWPGVYPHLEMRRTRRTPSIPTRKAA